MIYGKLANIYTFTNATFNLFNVEILTV